MLSAPALSFPDGTGFAIWYLWDAGTYTNGVHFFISNYPKYFWSKDWKRFSNSCLILLLLLAKAFGIGNNGSEFLLEFNWWNWKVKFIQLLFGNIKHWSSGANDCSDNLLRQDCWLKTYLKNIGLTIDWSMVIFQSLSGRNKSGLSLSSRQVTATNFFVLAIEKYTTFFW